MAREKLCPKCGEDITDSYVEGDRDSDIIIYGEYYCEKCCEGFSEEDGPE